MAKPEHLDKLLESVEVWNKWRYENFEIIPSLRAAYLKDADLRGADLREADLEEGDLSGANLKGAYLKRANLRGAVLKGANLSGVDFDRTDLKRADLEGTNLMGAINLRTEQLCKTKTLLQAEMDPDLENEVWYGRSHLLDKPKENMDR